MVTPAPSPRGWEVELCPGARSSPSASNPRPQPSAAPSSARPALGSGHSLPTPVHPPTLLTSKGPGPWVLPPALPAVHSGPSLCPAQVSFLHLSPGLNSKGPAGYGTPAPSSCCPQQRGSWWGVPASLRGVEEGFLRTQRRSLVTGVTLTAAIQCACTEVQARPGRTHTTLMLRSTFQEAELLSVAGVLAGGGMWGQWSLRTRQPQQQRLPADLPRRGMGAAARCQWNGDELAHAGCFQTSWFGEMGVQVPRGSCKSGWGPPACVWGESGPASVR